MFLPHVNQSEIQRKRNFKIKQIIAINLGKISEVHESNMVEFGL